MAHAVEGDADLEALEVALRLAGGDHVLVRKVRLLVALAEASPAYFDVFVNERPRRLRAWAQLAGHAARSAMKIAAGWTLLARHGRG